MSNKATDFNDVEVIHRRRPTRENNSTVTGPGVVYGTPVSPEEIDENEDGVTNPARTPRTPFSTGVVEVKG